MRDLTDKRPARDNYKLAIELCPSGMVMTDQAGRIVMVNAETERLFGYRREELAGRPVEVLVPERQRSQHLRHRAMFAANAHARRLGDGRDFLCGQRKDGSEFPVEVGLNRIKVGDELLVLAAIVDITERKRLEQLKDEFVSTVSHELRTPLTSIAGSLGLLLGAAAGELSEPTRRLLSIAQANSHRLVKLVNDILDIEKLESGQVVFKFMAVDLRALIEQTIEANLGFAHTYLVRLRFDFTADGEVWADPDRLSQVVTNLISNAIKFSPLDGEVVVAFERHGKDLRLSVRDHGGGIPPYFKSHIFEKFAQADEVHTKRSAGTGLGLSIVKEIVARLGGEVGFHDAPGGGTIFYVDLHSCEHTAEARPRPRPIDVFKQSA
jgi:PAS domain S-box-containing protein